MIWSWGLITKFLNMHSNSDVVFYLFSLEKCPNFNIVFDSSSLTTLVSQISIIAVPCRRGAVDSRG